MSEPRPWILNLNMIDDIFLCGDDELNSAICSAYRIHRIKAPGYKWKFKTVAHSCRRYSAAAKDAAERGFDPIIVSTDDCDPIAVGNGDYYPVEYMRDWLAEVHLHSPRHHRAIINRRMSFKQMIDAAKLWHESMRRAAEKLRNRAIPRDDIGAPTVLELHGEWLGWRWVLLKSDEARDAEGAAMGNCVGSGFYDGLTPDAGVLSLRDHDNEPHVTAELDGLNVEQAECRGGADVSERFQPLVDRMSVVIGVRLLIHNDPMISVEDGIYVVDSVAAGDPVTYHVADGVLHRDGGPALIRPLFVEYYERGKLVRSINMVGSNGDPNYYKARVVESPLNISALGIYDNYYVIGSKFRVETRVDIDGRPFNPHRKWEWEWELMKLSERRSVPPAVNAYAPEFYSWIRP